MSISELTDIVFDLLLLCFFILLPYEGIVLFIFLEVALVGRFLLDLLDSVRQHHLRLFRGHFAFSKSPPGMYETINAVNLQFNQSNLLKLACVFVLEISLTDSLET